MFIGEFYHSLDEKGRVNFPAKLREELGEQFVITKGLDGCLSAYSMEKWEQISKIVEGLPQAKARNLKRFMFSSATVVNPDKQGRVLVIQNLRDFANITKDIAVIGASDHVELWDKETWLRLNAEMDSDENSRARFFPTTGGILKTMEPEISGYTYLALDGVENCMNALRDIEAGKIHKCFIEMSACVGSCISGPVMEKYHSSHVHDYLAISAYAGKKDFDVEQPKDVVLKKHFEYIEQRAQMPSETEIMQILRQMGKYKPSQELNCGTCGYNTCRDKAIAIYQGKAEPSMCLPFLKDKAESFSDAIVNSSPNGLIVLNEQMEVQQINEAAKKIMNIRYDSDIVGDQVVRILDPTMFLKVLNSGRDIHDQRIYLAEYKRFVEQTVMYDRDTHLLIGILRDVTNEESDRVKKENISRQTIEVADKVVDKQMRIVQEIASLLGETAAETKIALAKLKESIEDE